MPIIQTQLSEEEDQILSNAAKKQRRSKREQLAFSAIEHARQIIREAAKTQTKEEAA